MKVHAIIPIFIPHSGCRNDCVFCNQRKITARTVSPTQEQVRETVEQYLSTLESRSLPMVEIAFYGGSFTGLALEEQNSYLSAAAEYKRAGRVQKIRLSTRPDYINPAILDNLKEWGVDTVELGVQSFDEQVLRLANRGHNAAQVYESARLLHEYGFELGIQLMVGLPGDTLEKDIFSAKELVSLKPSIARIYPTVVLPDTELHRMALSGEYAPLSLEEAVHRTKEMVKIIEGAGINIIRIGLKSSELIHSGEGTTLMGETYHPAFRQLVEGELARESLVKQMEVHWPRRENLPERILFASSSESFSNLIGHQKKNKKYFAETVPCVKIEYVIDSTLKKNQYTIKEDIENESSRNRHR